MKKIVVVDGFRTAFCKEGTMFNAVEPEILAAMAIKEMIRRIKDFGMPLSCISHVIGSNVATPSHAPNIARVAAIKGGLPLSVTADTMGKNCGSGMVAVNYAKLLLESRHTKATIVVGVESMSRIPFLYPDHIKNAFLNLSKSKTVGEKIINTTKLYSKLLTFWKKENQPKVGLVMGLTDPICGMGMGMTAEKLAKDPCFGITRQEQDEFALRSHKNASRAQKDGLLKEETVSLFVPNENKFVHVENDNGIRHDQTFEALARLSPLFDKRYGSVTAGNSSQITDGASCMLLMDEQLAKAFDLPILGYIRGYVDFGFDPSRMGLAAAGAIMKLLYHIRFDLKDFSVIEINEAFAAQVIACVKTLDSECLMEKWFGIYGNTSQRKLGQIQDRQLNPNGGAIALGHPVGVSGMRLIITALKELKRRNEERAIVSACVGGGQGVAMILEREC